MNRDAKTNALTFDVEEYYHVSAFEKQIPRSEWMNWESRVEYSTGLLLDLLDEKNTTATFFTLGIIAEKHPNLIRRIVDEGHELACHGQEHTRVNNQNEIEFQADIERAKKSLEDVSGEQVIGYRAASFSINAINHWAFEFMAQAGFMYSSSVYPINHDLYGIPDAPRFPFHPISSSPLVEIPITTFRLFKRNYPAGGGGYFRLYPYWITKYLIGRFNDKDLGHANMYFHPWEFDPNQPRPAGISSKTRFRHYINQSRSLERLRSLLGDFQWSSMRNVYADRLPQ